MHFHTIDTNFISATQVRWFDGWSIHCLVELVWRYLVIWAHCRWIRCYHFEQKHQWVKALWRNTNGDGSSKAWQIMKNLMRKLALLHVLLGGYWFRRVLCDGNPQVKLFKMGPAAAAHVANPKSLAHKVLDSMTSSELPEEDPDADPLRRLDSELMVRNQFCPLARIDAPPSLFL